MYELIIFPSSKSDEIQKFDSQFLFQALNTKIKKQKKLTFKPRCQ